MNEKIVKIVAAIMLIATLAGFVSILLSIG